MKVRTLAAPAAAPKTHEAEAPAAPAAPALAPPAPSTATPVTTAGEVRAAAPPVAVPAGQELPTPRAYPQEGALYLPRSGDGANPLADGATPRSPRAFLGRAFKTYEREFPSGVTGSPVGLLLDQVVSLPQGGTLSSAVVYVENCGALTINVELVSGTLTDADSFQVKEILDDDSEHAIYQGDGVPGLVFVAGRPLSITVGPSVGSASGGPDTITTALKVAVPVVVPKRVRLDILTNQAAGVRIWMRGV